MSLNKLNELKNIQTTDGANEQLLPIVLAGHVNYAPTYANSMPYSEALILTKFGKFNYFLIFISGMILGNVVLESTGISFILPIAECDLHLSNQDKGVLGAIGYAGVIASLHLWGFLTDTTGRRRVIRPTLIAAFITTVFSSFSDRFWIMVLLRFINGFFIAGGAGATYAYIGEFHTDKTRSRAIMGCSFIFSCGCLMLPLIAFLVINQDWALPIPFLGIVYKPWRLFLVVCGVPGLLCGLSLYFLPESPKFLMSIGKEAKAIEVLQKMNLWNGGTEPLKIVHIEPEVNEIGVSALYLSKDVTSKPNLIVTFLRAMWLQTVPLFHRKYLRTTFIVCTLQFWMYNITSGIYVWFPYIINSLIEFEKQHPGEHKKMCQIIYDKQGSLHKEDGHEVCVNKLEDKTYFYALIMHSLYAVGFIFIGAIINRVGKIPILFMTIIICTSCGIAAIFVTDPSLASYFYVLLFLVGVGNFVLSAAVVDLYPTNFRAMAVCISLLVGRLGSVAGATVAGALLATKCEWTFYIACGALFMSAFLTFLLPRKTMDTASQKTDDIKL